MACGFGSALQYLDYVTKIFGILMRKVQHEAIFFHGAKHSPPGVEKWKNQGPTIRLFLAASNGASAKNIEDPAKC